MRIDKLNFKRSNLQSALKPDEDRIGEKRKEIAKKEEEINTINAKLSKKRQEIDKIDDKKLKNDIVIERKLKALKTDK
jgi:predicted  nucleic acid-binding Zn-ribbon protein